MYSESQFIALKWKVSNEQVKYVRVLGFICSVFYHGLGVDLKFVVFVKSATINKISHQLHRFRQVITWIKKGEKLIIIGFAKFRSGNWKFAILFESNTGWGILVSVTLASQWFFRVGYQQNTFIQRLVYWSNGVESYLYLLREV